MLNAECGRERIYNSIYFHGNMGEHVSNESWGKERRTHGRGDGNNHGRGEEQSWEKMVRIM